MTTERESAIERAFWQFHEGNPHVYARLAALARELVGRGRRRIGIGMLFEVLRWHHMSTVGDADGFKLNNNYRALYARLLMASEPDLDGVFALRRIGREPFDQTPAEAPVGHVAPPRYEAPELGLPDPDTLF